MLLEKIRQTQKEAAQVIYFTHFAFVKALQEIRQPEREAEDNFRDGPGPLGIIKYRICCGPLVDHEERQRHCHKSPQHVVQGTWQKLGQSIPPRLPSTASLLVPPRPDAECFEVLGSYSYYSHPSVDFLPYCPHLILTFPVSSPPTTFTFYNWLVHVGFLNSAHSLPPCLLSSLHRTLVRYRACKHREHEHRKKHFSSP